MPKDPDLDEFILKVLEKGALNGIKLKNEAINLLPDVKKPKNPKKTFDESIMRLMDNDEVQIVGYNKKSKVDNRRQNFKSDYLIFDLMIDNSLEIRHLFNEMENDKLNIAKEAKSKLKNLFSGRIKSIEFKKLEKWKTTEDSLIIRNLNDDELAWVDAYWKYKVNSFYHTGEYIRAEHHLEEYSGNIEYESLMAKKRLPKLREKYNYLKIRHLPDEKPSIPIKDLDDAERFIRQNLIYVSEDEKQIIDWQIKEQGLEGQIDELIDCLFMYNKPLTDYEFLKEKLGFSKPKIMTLSEINELFEDIISYIRSQDNGKAVLIEKFVIGLSRRKHSDEYLEDLISEISKNTTN